MDRAFKKVGNIIKESNIQVRTAAVNGREKTRGLKGKKE